MEPRQGRLPQFLIPLVFLALGACGVLTHEFWRDEAGPWLVIRSSHSVREMIANLGYTGHTLSFFVWQYYLFKFFHTPIAGSIANVLLMAAAIWMFVRTSPFSTAQKWLFALGFFPLYQYAVFNRMYAFLVFFLFAYCALYVAKPRRTLLRWLMLILMAETHILGMLAAIPLAVLDIARTWGKENSKFETLFLFFKLSFFIFALVTVIWQLWPQDQNYHSLHPASPFLVFVGFADGFWPNYGLFYRNFFWSLLQITAGILFWLAATIILRRHRDAFITFAALLLPLAIFSAVIYAGHRWHHGFYWMYWVMAIWMAGAGAFADRRLRRMVTFLFSLHAAMGLYALIDDGLHPYSNAPAVAQYLRENHLEHLPMVGMEVFGMEPEVFKWEVDQLQPLLLKMSLARVYDPVAKSWIQTWRNYSDKFYFPRHDLQEMTIELQQVARDLPHPFLVVMARDRNTLYYSPPPPLQFLADFPDPIDYGEKLELFLHP